VRSCYQHQANSRRPQLLQQRVHRFRILLRMPVGVEPTVRVLQTEAWRLAPAPIEIQDLDELGQRQQRATRFEPCPRGLEARCSREQRPCHSVSVPSGRHERGLVVVVGQDGPSLRPAFRSWNERLPIGRRSLRRCTFTLSRGTGRPCPAFAIYSTRLLFFLATNCQTRRQNRATELGHCGRSCFLPARGCRQYWRCGGRTCDVRRRSHGEPGSRSIAAEADDLGTRRRRRAREAHARPNSGSGHHSRISNRAGSPEFDHAGPSFRRHDKGPAPRWSRPGLPVPIQDECPSFEHAVHDHPHFLDV